MTNLPSFLPGLLRGAVAATTALRCVRIALREGADFVHDDAVRVVLDALARLPHLEDLELDDFDCHRSAGLALPGRGPQCFSHLRNLRLGRNARELYAGSTAIALLSRCTTRLATLRMHAPVHVDDGVDGYHSHNPAAHLDGLDVITVTRPSQPARSLGVLFGSTARRIELELSPFQVLDIDAGIFSKECWPRLDFIAIRWSSPTRIDAHWARQLAEDVDGLRRGLAGRGICVEIDCTNFEVETSA